MPTALKRCCALALSWFLLGIGLSEAAKAQPSQSRSVDQISDILNRSAPVQDAQLLISNALQQIKDPALRKLTVQVLLEKHVGREHISRLEAIYRNRLATQPFAGSRRGALANA